VSSPDQALASLPEIRLAYDRIDRRIARVEGAVGELQQELPR
jgi:hypothetical protein